MNQNICQNFTYIFHWAEKCNKTGIRLKNGLSERPEVWELLPFVPFIVAPVMRFTARGLTIIWSLFTIEVMVLQSIHDIWHQMRLIQAFDQFIRQLLIHKTYDTLLNKHNKYFVRMTTKWKNRFDHQFSPFLPRLEAQMKASIRVTHRQWISLRCERWSTDNRWPDIDSLPSDDWLYMNNRIQTFEPKDKIKTFSRIKTK